MPLFPRGAKPLPMSSNEPDFPDFRILVQARMSSRRFPGKVLAPLAGRPVIERVLSGLGRAFGVERVVLATSDAASDDPLAGFGVALGYAVHRGPLDHVLLRYQEGARAYPARWIVRVCGDSPFLDSAVIARLLRACDAQSDLVTNVAPRTFPPGQSVEIIRASALLAIDAGALDAQAAEHPTQVFYRDPVRFCIRNLASPRACDADESWVVDTLDDLRRLEAVLESGNGPRPFAIAPADCADAAA
ncbi:MAG: cytidylyltransferase domain-containing protein [Burkholderiales bacterium]